MDLGAPELLIVLIVVLVLFGGAKLPKLARSLGQAQNEFKKAVQGDAPADEPATATTATAAESAAPAELPAAEQPSGAIVSDETAAPSATDS